MLCFLRAKCVTIPLHLALRIKKNKKCCQIGQIVKQKQVDKENGSAFRGHFWWLTSQRCFGSDVWMVSYQQKHRTPLLMWTVKQLEKSARYFNSYLSGLMSWKGLMLMNEAICFLWYQSFTVYKVVVLLKSHAKVVNWFVSDITMTSNTALLVVK